MAGQLLILKVERVTWLWAGQRREAVMLEEGEAVERRSMPQWAEQGWSMHYSTMFSWGHWGLAVSRGPQGWDSMEGH